MRAANTKTMQAMTQASMAVSPSAWGVGWGLGLNHLNALTPKRLELGNKIVSPLEHLKGLKKKNLVTISNYNETQMVMKYKC